MIKLFFSRQHDPGKGKAPTEVIPESTDTNPEESNITDGGEFLDDGIRMKEQPFLGREEEDKTEAI